MADVGEMVVLLASSTESRTIARDLRARLPASWRTILWDEGVMTPGRSSWQGLLEIGGQLDAAVLLLSADDALICRSDRHDVPRDNVIFEAGLFMGLLGPDRALLVQDSAVVLKLPSDLDGITKIRYPHPGQADDPRAAVDLAAREIERCLARLGRRGRDAPPVSDPRQALDDEVDRLGRSATARGWKVVRETPSVVTFRYAGAGPIAVRLTLADPERAREELRAIGLVLHKLGVRVARDLLPVSARRS